MWANAQRDGRPAEHRCALCSMPQSLADTHYWTAKMLVGRSSPYCGDIWRTYRCL